MIRGIRGWSVGGLLLGLGGAAVGIIFLSTPPLGWLALLLGTMIAAMCATDIYYRYQETKLILDRLLYEELPLQRDIKPLDHAEDIRDILQAYPKEFPQCNAKGLKDLCQELTGIIKQLKQLPDDDDRYRKEWPLKGQVHQILKKVRKLHQPLSITTAATAQPGNNIGTATPFSPKSAPGQRPSTWLDLRNQEYVQRQIWQLQRYQPLLKAEQEKEEQAKREYQDAELNTPESAIKFKQLKLIQNEIADLKRQIGEIKKELSDAKQLPDPLPEPEESIEKLAQLLSCMDQDIEASEIYKRGPSRTVRAFYSQSRGNLTAFLSVNSCYLSNVSHCRADNYLTAWNERVETLFQLVEKLQQQKEHYENNLKNWLKSKASNKQEQIAVLQELCDHYAGCITKAVFDSAWNRAIAAQQPQDGKLLALRMQIILARARRKEKAARDREEAARDKVSDPASLLRFIYAEVKVECDIDQQGLDQFVKENPTDPLSVYIGELRDQVYVLEVRKKLTAPNVDGAPQPVHLLFKPAEVGTVSEEKASDIKPDIEAKTPQAVIAECLKQAQQQLQQMDGELEKPIPGIESIRRVWKVQERYDDKGAGTGRRNDIYEYKVSIKDEKKNNLTAESEAALVDWIVPADAKSGIEEVSLPGIRITQPLTETLRQLVELSCDDTMEAHARTITVLRQRATAELNAFRASPSFDAHAEESQDIAAQMQQLQISENKALADIRQQQLRLVKLGIEVISQSTLADVDKALTPDEQAREDKIQQGKKSRLEQLKKLQQGNRENDPALQELNNKIKEAGEQQPSDSDTQAVKELKQKKLVRLEQLRREHQAAVSTDATLEKLDNELLALASKKFATLNQQQLQRAQAAAWLYPLLTSAAEKIQQQRALRSRELTQLRAMLQQEEESLQKQLKEINKQDKDTDEFSETCRVLINATVRSAELESGIEKLAAEIETMKKDLAELALQYDWLHGDKLINDFRIERETLIFSIINPKKLAVKVDYTKPYERPEEMDNIEQQEVIWQEDSEQYIPTLMQTLQKNRGEDNSPNGSTPPESPQSRSSTSSHSHSPGRLGMFSSTSQLITLPRTNENMGNGDKSAETSLLITLPETTKAGGNVGVKSQSMLHHRVRHTTTSQEKFRWW